MELTVSHIYEWLEEVKDPEIPVLAITDLGIVTSVNIGIDRIVKIELTPTFTGCPALDQIKEDIRRVLAAKSVKEVEIEISYRNTWTSDMISAKGREALRQFGIAPPRSMQVFADIDILEGAICPRCNGNNTDVKNTFGATLCRSIHYCNDCREAFEQFKPI